MERNYESKENLINDDTDKLSLKTRFVMMLPGLMYDIEHEKITEAREIINKLSDLINELSQKSANALTLE